MQGNATWRLMMGAGGGKSRPTLVGTAVTPGTDTQVNSVSMNLPAGVQNGDLIIACVCAAKGTVTDWVQTSFTWAVEQNAARPSLAVAYRIASSEPSSYTFTTSTARSLGGSILAYRGAAWDTIGSLSTTSTANSVTATENLSILLGFWAEDSVNFSFSTPSGMSTTGAGYVDAAIRPSWNIFTQDVNAGATGTKASTSGGANTASVLLTIKPS